MAVREPDRLFVNGVDLGKHWFLTVESTYQMPAQVRDGLVETPGRHGARGSGRPPLYDVGAGKLVLHVGEPQRGHLREVLDELIGLLTGGSEVVLRHASGGQAREAVIAVQSWNVTERVPQVFADLEVSYVVPGVFLRSLTTRERTIPPGSSVLPREGTAPITDAIVRFAGPSYGSHTVIEGVWGTGISWGGSLVSGQYVFVDPRAMRAWQGASGDWHRPSTVKDVSTSLSPETAGPLSLHHTTGWGAGAVTATNLFHDPFFRYGVGSWYVDAAHTLTTVPVPAGSPVEGNALRLTTTNQVASGPSWRGGTVDTTGHEGRVVHVGMWARTNRAGTQRVFAYWAASGLEREEATFQADEWRWVTRAYPIGSTPHRGDLFIYEPESGDPDHEWLRTGITIVIRDTAEPLRPSDVFDGDTPDTDELVYEWTGTPGQSASTVGPRALVRSTPLTASKAATIRYREAWL